jgi:hypothetical protein
VEVLEAQNILRALENTVMEDRKIDFSTRLEQMQ